jgi:hypothetical protein
MKQFFPNGYLAKPKSDFIEFRHPFAEAALNKQREQASVCILASSAERVAQIDWCSVCLNF